MKGPKWLGRVSGSAGEAKNRFEADRRQRAAAGKAPNSIILRPDEVAGHWDAARALMTTLGGTARRITAEDLAAFRRNMQLARKSFHGYEGITARQVLDLASANPLNYKSVGKGTSDLDRARSEIRAAIPVAATPSATTQGGLDVRFLTDSAPNSRVVRHHVIVRLNAFRDARTQLVEAGVADKAASRKIAGWLRKQKLAFDCDCGRHRYFLRYVATLGGFNAGRPETGYPKIRNPDLHGVACKHVLRVMAELESSGTVLSFLERALVKAMNDSECQLRMVATQAQANAGLAKQQSSGPRAIQTTADRAVAARAARERQAILRAASKAAIDKSVNRLAPASRRLSRGQKNAVAALAAQFGMTTEAVMALLPKP